MKKINEENLKNYFEKYYAENTNLVSVFKKIEEKVKLAISDKHFESIEDNYLPLFIYEAVKAAVPVEEFRDFMQYVYQKNVLGNSEYTFSRFFNDSSDIYLFKYVDDKRTSDSYWDDLHFLFLDNDKNKKHIFYEKTFPYLKVILEEVDEKNIQYLKSSQLSFYLLRFRENIDKIKPVLDIMDNNSAYLYVDLNDQYGDISIIADVIKLVGHIEEDNLKKLFINTITSLKSFDKIMENKLIEFKQEGNSKRLSVDYSYAKYINHYGKDKTLELIEKISKNLISQEPNYEKKVDLLTTLSFSFEHTLYDYDLPIQIEKIDINKSLFDNWIPIKMLQVAVKNNKKLDIPLEIVKYIQAEIRSLDSNKSGDWSLIYSLGLNQSQSEDFSKALFARSLELKLPSNNIEVKRNKL